MESPAGARGAEEGRASFDQSLREVMRRRSPVERRQVRAIFHGIHSGPFWQMLRDRGGLSGPEAIAAAGWAAQALLDTLRREQPISLVNRRTKRKKETETYDDDRSETKNAGVTPWPWRT